MAPSISTQYTNSAGDFGVTFIEPSLTVQSFAGEADINYIMEKYIQTGLLTNVSNREDYRDIDFNMFGDNVSFAECMERVVAGERSFMTLPATVRAMFDNDPGALITWLQDTGNAPEAVDTGILTQAPVAPSTPIYPPA